MAPETETATPVHPPRGGEAVPLLVVTALLVAVTGLFVAPWLPSGPTRGTDLDRYGPARDGSAYLLVERDASGDVVAWESQNVRRVPGLRATTEWRPQAADALANYLEADGLDTVARTRRLSQVDALQISVREAGADGVRASELFAVVDADGQRLLAVHDVDAGTDLVFDPPLLVRPTALPPGARWESEGTFGLLDYASTAEVVDQAPRDTELGRFDDCILIEERFVLSSEGETLADTTSRAWSCADIGAVVHAEDLDETGAVTATRTLTSADARTVAAPDRPGPTGLVAVPAAAGGDAATGDDTATGDDAALAPDEQWTPSRVGSARFSFSADTATVPPTWVPGTRPLVLTAARGSDLVAFDARTGEVAWRFHPGGTVQGQPRVADGRIFFGATDKRVYALDTDGLFLWSRPTGDSVPTRPVIAAGTVVVGSEDRRIHGLDPATGASRWSVATGGPVAASPVEVGGLVAAGGDDGGVRLLDPRDGRVVETITFGEPIVAALAAGDGHAIIAGTGGTVAALTPDDGIVWRTTLDAGVSAAPVVVDGSVAVVTDNGELHRLGLDDGAVQASTATGDYTGAPLAVADQGVVVATRDGTLHHVAADGSRVGSWDVGAVAGVGDAAPEFELGPTAGGGAVWIVDGGGVLYRLGPPDAVAAPAVSLRPRWMRTLTDAPFSDGGAPITTPVAWRGRALTLDAGSRVLLTDPATGDTDVLGTIDDHVAYVAPVVVDDLLLLAGNGRLQARTLPDLDLAWVVEGPGASGRPPVVAGRTVLYTSGSSETGAPGEAVLVAVDLDTGTERWRVDLGATPLAGGVAVHDGAVIAGSPLTARDLTTGEVRWTADVTDATIGGPALRDGVVHAVTLATDGSDVSTLLALDAASGERRWTVDLGDVSLNPVAAVLLSGDVAVLPTFDGHLVAHDLDDGTRRWEHRAASPLLGLPSLVDDTLWAALQNGRALVLDPATGAVTGAFSDLEMPLESQARAQQPGAVGDQVLVSYGYFLLAFDR